MEKEKFKKVSTVVFVKNLPYDATQEDLQNTYSQFGNIKRCFVVKDSGSQGKCKGYGYVTFSSEEEVKKCVKERVVVRGRKIQAIPAKPRIKNDSRDFKKLKGKEQTNKDEEKLDDDEYDESMTNSKAVDDEKEEEEEIEENEEAMDADEDQDDEEDEKGDKNDEEEEEEDEEGEEEEEEDDEDEEQDQKRSKQMKRKEEVKRNNRDAEEGRTLFIRNLSFEVTEEDLVDFFEEFGGLNYCRVVINPVTEVSRGTAFVKFRRKEDAENCLDQFEQDEDAFVLEGRRMVVMKAVVKDRADEMSCKRKNEEGLKKASQKNLHLVKLTMIAPGSKEAAGMSNEDLHKRMKVAEMTKQKLRNPNIFVSDTRLCVRNIPATTTDKQLRQIFLEAANDKKAKITECRIMRDLQRLNSEGVGKSKGYAFIRFSNPCHAMKAVLATNNNCNIFSNQKRPMVEFSLENRSALEVKQKREEKCRLSRQDNKKPQHKSVLENGFKSLTKRGFENASKKSFKNFSKKGFKNVVKKTSKPSKKYKK